MLSLGAGFVIVVIGLVVFGIIQCNSSLKEREKASEENLIDKKIVLAQETIYNDSNIWENTFKYDSKESKKSYFRHAFIRSYDDLCKLEVQHRNDQTKLTEIDCYDIKLDSSFKLSIKFDDSNTIYNLKLNKYNNSDIVYTDSYQTKNKDSLRYSKFLSKIKKHKIVSITHPSLFKRWIKFSLSGSSLAINRLGTINTN